MQANPRSLDVLFNSQLRYVVPMFQRKYVWEETPQWSTLWEDVAEKADLQIIGNKSNAHYLGALIIEGVRPSSPREVKRFLVIDGQQRLTTLQILFCAYRDLALKNGWVSLGKTTTRYLENDGQEVMEYPEEEKYKIWPTTLNREVFKKIISAGGCDVVEKLFPLIRLPRKKYPEKRDNLVDAYLYFSKTIEFWITQTSIKTGKSPEDCAFALLLSLQQDFCVVEISLSEGDDSQEIFYSLNSQGRPLSQSDLLRSLIFMRAEKEKINRDMIFELYWSKFETSFWSTELKRGGRSCPRLDWGLRLFLMAKTGKTIDARRVNEEYRHWISAQPLRYPSVKEELADFSKYCEAYQRYESVSPFSLPSTDLRRVLLDFDVSTVLPLILYLEIDAGLDPIQLAECLFIIESFIARRIFTGEETKEYNIFFVEVIGSLRDLTGEQVKLALVKKLLAGGGSTRHWPTNEEIIEKAISRLISSDMRTPALRLILERLEINQRTNKSEGTELPSNLQIEHVLPQKWATFWPLKDKFVPAEVVNSPYLAKDDLANLGDAIRLRNDRLQTLGNLTLLNKYLNPAASNGSYETKLEEYKHSVLRLNRYFVEQITWDEEAISERSKMLGEQFCKIWPRPNKIE
jgi:hypothetical protein